RGERPLGEDRLIPPDSEPRLAGAVGRYREWPATASLQGDVACVWQHALPVAATPALQIVPDACIDIVWSGQTLLVAGPDTQPMIETFAPGTVVVGVRFRPGAASPWLGVPASAIVNRRVPLHDLWGDDARRLVDRLPDSRTPLAVADTVLAALLARGPLASLQDDAAPAVLAALSRSADAPVPVSALARQLGLSERTLRRRCEAAFGYGPKTLGRILRFQQVLRLLRRPADARLAEMAVETGFADQAHMTREVRRLGGLTPGAFTALCAA
ncbi:MAG: helix-turn-helix domain-containing protein, partial [Dongiaceae bacterium]